MTKPPRKQRLSVYLDPAVMNRLAEHAARRDHSRSLIAEAAIESFLSPDAAERQEAVITKRLDQLDRRMTRLERDVGIAVESLAVFIKFWVATTPALPEPAARAARARPAARQRAEAPAGDLGRREHAIDASRCQYGGSSTAPGSGST